MVRCVRFYTRLLALGTLGLLGLQGAPLAHSQVGFTQTGMASYYADFFHGRATASGEAYDKTALTAAHRELAFHTLIKVTAVATGRSVVVRINDRGPYAQDRVVDLSRAAAAELGMLEAGLVKVRLEVVGLSGQTKPAQDTKPDLKPDPKPESKPEPKPKAAATAAPPPPPRETPRDWSAADEDEAPAPATATASTPPANPALPGTPPAPLPERPAGTPVSPGFFGTNGRPLPQRALAIQTGTFADYDNAYAHLRKLNAAGFAELKTQVEERDGQRLYRTLVGDFDAQSLAAQTLAQLQAKGFEGFAVNFGLPTAVLPGQPSNEAPFTQPGTYTLDGARVNPRQQGAYGLQLGVFRELESARRAHAQAEAAGYTTLFLQVDEAEDQPAQGPPAMRYRVLLGVYATEEVARQHLPELKAKGLDALVAPHL